MNRIAAFPIAVGVLVLAACSNEQTSFTAPDVHRAPLLAKAAGGKTTFAYTLSGDATTPVSSAPAVASTSPTKPFYNLSVSGVSVALSAPTGDISRCKTGNGTYATDFGANAGTVWTGTLSIPTTGTMSFLGTDGAGTTVQFSVSDATGGPVQSAGATPGSYDYSYTDARFYFGGNSSHYDGLYRCVNITVTAAP